MPLFLAAALCCTISGNVRAASGAPLAGARVEVSSAQPARSISDRSGRFELTVKPGQYELDASSEGFASVSVSLDATHDATVQITLEPVDSPKLRQIGTVTVDGRLAPNRGAIPAVTFTRSSLDALGDDRIVDGLQMLPGTALTRPDGGAASAVAVVSLRGPDPSESLLALDGQLLNDGNTGDLDISRLPVAAFSAVDVTEGLGPQDSNGSNTFGGAINFVSLRPTKDPHAAFALSDGSFGRTEAWLNTTGTQGRLGYAFALDDQNESGYVNGQTVRLYSNSNPNCAPCATTLGSSVASHTALGTLTWSFAQDADLTARIFALGDRRDQSAALNGIDQNPGDVGMPQYGQFTGPGDQTFAQTIRAYQLRGRMPLGAGELSADVSTSDNGIDVNGGSGSPYDVDHVDHRYNAGVTWQRTFATSQFAIGGYTRYESLDFGGPPNYGQSINVFFLRGGFEPLARLRLDAGLFESHYTTFGSNLDGRFAAIYGVAPDTSLRLSLGTGFRAPLLAERIQFPYQQLALDGNGVFVGQGSPNEQPERATEYEFGLSHEFGKTSTLDLSLYHTNLRDPVEVFYPLTAVAAGKCANNSYQNPIAACVSYQGNVGNAVYEGAEARYVQRLTSQLYATAAYGLNVSYPKDLNAQFSNPTSGGNLVDNAQFLGIPQQQGSFQLDWSNHDWHAAGAAVFRGKNNDLNLGPYTLVNASVGKKLGRNLDLSLAGTNLFSAASGRFTVFGAGVPYRGIVDEDASGAPVYGPLPTDALHIEPIGIRAVLTVRY
jgi:outer membrane receptor protein involved in Fe transport